MPRYHYKSYEGITSLARNLRRRQTPSEELMWELLRRKSFSGYKFLRQHPVFYRIDGEWVEFFIADFYCAKLKLIIEVDGPIHQYNLNYDSERDSKLNNKGIMVTRILNDELVDINFAISKLIQIMRKRETEIADNKMNISYSFNFKEGAGGRVKKKEGE
jgi:very-short-patch-repair endonuclease